MTQNEQIAQHLLRANKLTSLEALNKFGCFRLASRISDLRHLGFIIHDHTIETTTGKRVSEYFMKDEDYAQNFKLFMRSFSPKPQTTKKPGQIEWILPI